MDLCLIHSLANRLLLPICKLHIKSSQILLQVLYLPRPRNRKDVISLRHQPSQSQLPWRAALRSGELLDLFHKHEVLGKILRREAWVEAAHVSGFEVFGGLDLPGQHAPGQWGVGDDGDAKLMACLEKTDVWMLDVGCERAVFDLHSCDGVDCMGSAERVGGDFGEAQVFDLAFTVRF